MADRTEVRRWIQRWEGAKPSKTGIWAVRRRLAEAMPIYDWFMPLLHLDARSDLVQCIKLCEHLAGRGSAVTRPPRLALEGAEKEEVEAIMARALASRPDLPDVGITARDDA